MQLFLVSYAFIPIHIVFYLVDNAGQVAANTSQNDDKDYANDVTLIIIILLVNRAHSRVKKGKYRNK